MVQKVKTNILEDSSQLSALDTFRATYPLGPPRAGSIRHSDEVRQITPQEGLEEFNLALGSKAKKSELPHSEPRGNTYLWVIAKDAIPAAIEEYLHTGSIKHTNLTGGAEAHSGGEVWFIEEDAIVLGGSSGRYGPDLFDEKPIVDAGRVFKEQGYRVAVLGMDETGFPATLLVGEPQWL